MRDMSDKPLPSDDQHGLSETPKMKCNKRNLISDEGMKISTLTLAPMGMVAPRRCQERQISGRARQCLHPLGDGIIISTDKTNFGQFY